MKGSIISILLLCAQLVSSQDSTKRLPYVRYDLNRLTQWKDSSGMKPFFSKLRMLEEGKADVRIVHIGGSHVQGGTWSNSFARLLQEHFKGRGGGYHTFPYQVGRTNGPVFCSSRSTGKWKLCRTVGKQNCRPVGMSAVSVQTSDSTASFTMAFNEKAFVTRFTQVKVYHNFSPSYAMEIDAALVSSREARPNDGYTLFNLTMPVDTLVVHVTRTDTSGTFILFGMTVETAEQPGIWLGALGANGASTASFLGLKEMKNELASLRGDLFILSLGVNDTQSKGFKAAEYQANYDSLINIIRLVAPSAGIILTTTTDNYIRRKTPNKRTAASRDVMLSLMRSRAVAVWDMYTVMGGYRSMSKWNKSRLASRDKVHFSPAGYNILANLMFRALVNSYENDQRK